MPRKKLTETLATLHRQLEQGPPLDDADRAQLAAIVADIQGVLDTDRDAESVGGRVRDSVEHFEASHPTIAAVLQSLAEALGRL